jgi:hypothetical protein
MITPTLTRERKGGAPKTRPNRSPPKSVPLALARKGPHPNRRPLLAASVGFHDWPICGRTGFPVVTGKDLNQGVDFLLRFLLAFGGYILTEPASSLRPQNCDLSSASEFF